MATLDALDVNFLGKDQVDKRSADRKREKYDEQVHGQIYKQNLKDQLKPPRGRPPKQPPTNAAPPRSYGQQKTGPDPKELKERDALFTKLLKYWDKPRLAARLDGLQRPDPRMSLLALKALDDQVQDRMSDGLTEMALKKGVIMLLDILDPVVVNMSEGRIPPSSQFVAENISYADQEFDELACKYGGMLKAGPEIRLVAKIGRLYAAHASLIQQQIAEHGGKPCYYEPLPTPAPSVPPPPPFIDSPDPLGVLKDSEPKKKRPVGRPRKESTA
jgi:hypothetical protein